MLRRVGFGRYEIVKTASAPARPAARRGVYADCGELAIAQPKEAPPVRDEAYRRLVAALPCFECRIDGHSQAAHPNTGKAKGKKLPDDRCFPLCCDRPGVVGCHTKFDQYKLVRRELMAQYEQLALVWVRLQLEKNA